MRRLIPLLVAATLTSSVPTPATAVENLIATFSVSATSGTPSTQFTFTVTTQGDALSDASVNLSGSAVIVVALNEIGPDTYRASTTLPLGTWLPAASITWPDGHGDIRAGPAITVSQTVQATPKPTPKPTQHPTSTPKPHRSQPPSVQPVATEAPTC